MCEQCKILQEQKRLLQMRIDDMNAVIDAQREQIKVRDKAIRHMTHVIETGAHISAKKLADYSEIGELV